jgi:hypothetical protein
MGGARKERRNRLARYKKPLAVFCVVGAALVVTWSAVYFSRPQGRDIPDFQNFTDYRRVSSSSQSEQAKQTIYFVESFLRGYFFEGQGSPLASYIDSLYLARAKSIRVEVYLSESREALAILIPSDTAALEISFTEYPIQFALVKGLFTTPGMGWQVPDMRKFLERYDSMSGTIAGVTSPGAYFVGNNIVVWLPKMFGIPPNSLIFQRNLSVKYYGEPWDSAGHDISLPDISILTSERSFAWAIQDAENYGLELARAELLVLISKSPILRRALAKSENEPRLRWVEQQLAMLKNAPFSSSFTEYQLRDSLDAIEADFRARGVTDDSLAIEETRSTVRLGLFSGYLFGQYFTAQGLMVRWFLMNLLLTLMLTILVWLPIRFGIVEWFSLKIFPSAMFTFSIWLNSHVYAYHAKNLIAFHWVLPAISIAVLLIFPYLVLKGKTVRQLRP